MRKRNKAYLILIMFVIIVTTMMGCVQHSKYEKGFSYTFAPDSIMLGVRSDTNSFKKDSVIINISYSMHDIGYEKKHNADFRSDYMITGYDKIVFGLYICDYEHRFDVLNSFEVADYKNIDNHYFIKEISEEDAFSDEYGRTMSYWSGITYNHSEELIIPADFFTKEDGIVVVKLAAFNEPLEPGGNYITSSASHIELRYRMLEARSRSSISFWSSSVRLSPFLSFSFIL